MLRYPERTGRPGDEIVRFDGYVLQHDSPPPEARGPTAAWRRQFIHWP